MMSVLVAVAAVAVVAVAGVEEVMVDLTHVVGPSTMTWPGGTPYNREVIHKGYQEPGGFWLENYNFCSAEHSGTHLDAPSHFAEDGWSVEQIPLRHLMGPGVVVDIQDKADNDSLAELTADDLKAWLDKHGPLPDRAIVLVRTGWASRYGNKMAYFGSDSNDTSKFAFPGISVGAAKILTAYESVEGRRVVGVGLDTPSLDHGLSTLYPTHVETSAANMFGLEHLADMSELPATGFWLTVMPMKLQDGSGAPARVVATFPNTTSSVSRASPHLLALALPVALLLLVVTFLSLRML